MGKVGVKQIGSFPTEDFQLKIFTAYDYLGQRMHWLILASRLDQELYAIWNSPSI